MKTNKQEREAIASKFIKKMKEDLILKNEKLKKKAIFSTLTKLEKKEQTLRDEAAAVNDQIKVQMAAYNKDYCSEYWSLSNEWRYGDKTEIRLCLENEYALKNDLCNAILIAQVNSDTVSDLMRCLEEEVNL